MSINIQISGTVGGEGTIYYRAYVQGGTPDTGFDRYLYDNLNNPYKVSTLSFITMNVSDMMGVNGVVNIGDTVHIWCWKSNTDYTQDDITHFGYASFTIPSTAGESYSLTNIGGGGDIEIDTFINIPPEITNFTINGSASSPQNLLINTPYTVGITADDVNIWQPNIAAGQNIFLASRIQTYQFDENYPTSYANKSTSFPHIFITVGSRDIRSKVLDGSSVANGIDESSIITVNLRKRPPTIAVDSFYFDTAYQYIETKQDAENGILTLSEPVVGKYKFTRSLQTDPDSVVVVDTQYSWRILGDGVTVLASGTGIDIEYTFTSADASTYSDFDVELTLTYDNGIEPTDTVVATPTYTLEKRGLTKLLKGWVQDVLLLIGSPINFNIDNVGSGSYVGETGAAGAIASITDVDFVTLENVTSTNHPGFLYTSTFNTSIWTLPGVIDRQLKVIIDFNDGYNNVQFDSGFEDVELAFAIDLQVEECSGRLKIDTSGSIGNITGVKLRISELTGIGGAVERVLWTSPSADSSGTMEVGTTFDDFTIFQLIYGGVRDIGWVLVEATIISDTLQYDSASVEVETDSLVCSEGAGTGSVFDFYLDELTCDLYYPIADAGNIQVIKKV